MNYARGTVSGPYGVAGSCRAPALTKVSSVKHLLSLGAKEQPPFLGLRPSRLSQSNPECSLAASGFRVFRPRKSTTVRLVLRKTSGRIRPRP